MFVIANDIVYKTRVAPFIDGGGLLTRIQGLQGGGLICTIGYPQPLVATANISAIAGNLATIDVAGLSLRDVAALDISGVRYSAGADPSNLQPGEFFWDVTNNQIIIRTC